MTQHVHSQGAAIFLGLSAVVLFAFFEHALAGLNNLTTIDAYLGCRVAITALMFFLLIVVVRKVGRIELASPVLNPLAMRSAIWIQAICTLSYQTALAIALSSSGLQSAIYPIFLLHPLWQILAQRVICRTWPSLSGRITGLALIMIGVVAFSFGQGLMNTHDGFSMLAQFSALAAGAGFAFTNEYGATLTSKPRHAVLHCQGGGKSISSLELAAYTTYASLWMLPVVLPVFAFGLGSLGLKSIGNNMAPLPSYANIITMIVIGGAFITIATWLFSEAFRRARARPQIAALDALILPIGIALDLWSGQLATSNSRFPLLIFSTILIVAGVAWMARAKAFRSSSRGTNNKPGS